MAGGMQFAAQDYSKICSIALYGDKPEQQMGVRDTQTFLQYTISNLKTYNPTAPEAVLPSLADISAYLYDSGDEPLIQSALAHYQFEMIHPFEEYNGIVGRIPVFMVLQKYNIIVQESNATRNRIWKYNYLNFIFTLPSIHQHAIS